MTRRAAGGSSPEDTWPEVRLVTDGACSGNPGPGGWACVLSSGGRVRELSGGESATTNNRMELTALLEGLRAMKKPCRVHVVSDSKYVIDALEQRWLEKWIAKGWKNVKNPDLWRLLAQEASRHLLTFEWVQGHAGHPENERADHLAVLARDEAARQPRTPRSGPVGGLF